MAAKVEPTIITLQIEDHTAIRQAATVVAKRGTKGVMRRVTFGTAAQLAEAIIAVEQVLAAEEIDAAAAQQAKQQAARKGAPKAKSAKSKPKLADTAESTLQAIEAAPAPGTRSRPPAPSTD